jgi:LacI family transcriptional regulator
VLLAWYATDVFRGIARFARDRDWVLDSSFERSGNVPPHWEGDGVIAVLGLHRAVDRFAAACRVPLVNIGYTNPDLAPRVAADQKAVADLAAEHLAERGFRQFAYYLRSSEPGDRGRWHAFREALARRGRQADCLHWQPPAGAAGGDDMGRMRWLSEELLRRPKPLAVFAEIDDYAIEVQEAARLAGLMVPEEVAVLGVGNDELRCPFAPVPLSSVDDNARGIGEAAAKLLDQLMSGRSAPTEAVLVQPVGVVTRHSTDMLAVDHPLVAQALHHIRDHFREPLTAEGMTAAIPMSRRRLHDAFLRVVGHSVADELERRRVEHAKLLLSDTAEKTDVVAQRSGFASASRLSIVFRRVTGMSPSDYRSRFNAAYRGP